MSVYVTDTHPLVWYAGGKKSMLSAKVSTAFEKADASEALIYIPAVTFWEIAILQNLGKIKLRENFANWSSGILAKSGFAIANLDIDIIADAVGFNFNNDPFDSAVVATAKKMDLSLITRDVAITESNLLEIFW